MDSAYEGDATRDLAEQLGFCAGRAAQSAAQAAMVTGQERYRRRNEVERLFRRIKGLAQRVHPL